MKKIIKSLILVMIIAMAFVAIPALAEEAPITTVEDIYQGQYEDTDEITGAPLSGDATIVYGILATESIDFGVEITSYGTTVWAEEVGHINLAATSTNLDGYYGVGFFNLPDGYYCARAYADGEFGEYVYFTVGFNAEYTVNLYLEGADGQYTLAETLTETGAIGTTVTASKYTVDGYELVEEDSTAELVIAESDNVMDLYFDLLPYDYAVLEMAENTYLNGEIAISTRGAGAGWYSPAMVNAYDGQIPSSWAEDGKYINFETWQNPAHARYTGTSMLLPDLDMDLLESITIRYIVVSDSFGLSSESVYLRANKPGEGNNVDNAIAIEGVNNGTWTAVEKTITKAELLAIMPEDDNATLHTLYVEGYGYKSTKLLVDSIRIDSTEEAIVAHNANLVDVETKFFFDNGTEYVEDAGMSYYVTVLAGLELTTTVPTITSWEFDVENENNVLTLTADGEVCFEIYYTKNTDPITYDFNGGKDADDNESVVKDYVDGGALMDGSDLIKEGYTFFGWSKTPVVTDFNGMYAAATLANKGIVEGGATYYAIWYGDDWLEFNDPDVIPLIVSGAYVDSVTKDIDGDGTEDVTLASRLWNPVGRVGGEYNATRILLPRIAFADLESMQWRAKIYSFQWTDPYYYGDGDGDSKWFTFVINGTPSSTTIENVLGSTSSVNGGFLSKTNTAADVEALVACGPEVLVESATHLVIAEFGTTQWNDCYTMLDYIRFVKKAPVEAEPVE